MVSVNALQCIFLQDLKVYLIPKNSLVFLRHRDFFLFAFLHVSFSILGFFIFLELETFSSLPNTSILVCSTADSRVI